MLDYRAHKLYVLLFSFPIFITVLFSILGLPLIASELTNDFSEQKIIWFLVGALALLLLELVFGVVFLFLDWVYKSLFKFLVDVMPTQGRSDQEAWQVVVGGRAAELDLKMSSANPSDWSDRDIDELVSIGFLSRVFFKNEKLQRLSYIRSRYASDDSLEIGISKIREILEDEGMTMGFLEKLVTVPLYRRSLASYLFYSYLIYAG